MSLFILIAHNYQISIFPTTRECQWRVFFLPTSCDNNIDPMHAHAHDDIIKWKHFPRYWPFVRGIHRSPMNSPHKGQWRGALMWINGWVNNRDAGDLRRHRAHYDVIVMECFRSAWAGSIDWHDFWSRCFTNSSSPSLTWINPTWISNCFNYKVWDKITYPFPNFNGYPWNLGMDK